MKLLFPAALAALALAAAPAAAQTRDDLRGPTGQQRVKLPPGVRGATGGPMHPRPHHRMVRHHRRRR